MNDQAKEKDNFWLMMVGIAALAIMGIFAFKNMDIRNEHVAGKGYSPDSTVQQEAAAFAKRKNLNNDVLAK